MNLPDLRGTCPRAHPVHFLAPIQRRRAASLTRANGLRPCAAASRQADGALDAAHVGSGRTPTEHTIQCRGRPHRVSKCDGSPRIAPRQRHTTLAPTGWLRPWPPAQLPGRRFSMWKRPMHAGCIHHKGQPPCGGRKDTFDARFAAKLPSPMVRSHSTVRDRASGIPVQYSFGRHDSQGADFSSLPFRKAS